MKDIEKICGSSLDHFLILDTDNTQLNNNTVVFSVKQPHPAAITIRDANNTKWSLVLNGDYTVENTQTSFKIVEGGTTTQTGLNLLECLKKNDIFYNFSIDTGGGVFEVICNIDTSKQYVMTSNDNYNIDVVNTSQKVNMTKYVVDVQAQNGNNKSYITLNKYATGKDISFNLTTPLSKTTVKYPYRCELFSYKTTDEGDNTDIINLNVTQFYILPTTLHKFNTVDFLDKYYKISGTPDVKNILSNNLNRTINYDETICFSFITDDTKRKLSKKFYTTSGRYLTKQTTYTRDESNVIRIDIYDKPDILTIEKNYNTQVGYIIYNIMDNDETTIISNDIRFDVVPSCNPNNIIYYINELGGVESFNFLGVTETAYTITDQNTYNITPTRPFEITQPKAIEEIKGKAQTIKYNLKSQLINQETAISLNELNKSKYVWILDNNLRETRIIVEKFDIEISSNTHQYQLTLTYHTSDNKINF